MLSACMQPISDILVQTSRALAVGELCSRESRDMKKIAANYSRLLRAMSASFRMASDKHQVTCRSGCFECCAKGFFDITLLDALHIRDNLTKVPAHIRERVVETANAQLDLLEQKGAFFRSKPLLTSLAAIDAISRRSVKLRCPALDERGACLIYEIRPLICRIFGPTVRGPRRADRLTGCGYYRREIPDTDFPLFSHYEVRDRLMKEMFTRAGRQRLWEVDTIIPAALALDLEPWLTPAAIRQKSFRKR